MAAAAPRPERRGLTLWLARGAGSGLGTAVIVIAVAALSRGDLGAGRLTGMGPVLLNLLWLAPAPMLVGGAAAALIHWFARGRHLPAVSAEDSTELIDLPTESLETETVVLGRD